MQLTYRTTGLPELWDYFEIFKPFTLGDTESRRDFEIFTSKNVWQHYSYRKVYMLYIAWKGADPIT